MDESTFNEKQIFILSSLRERLGKAVTERWLFMRNKHFNGKAPIDYLLSENYSYFEYILAD